MVHEWFDCVYCCEIHIFFVPVEVRIKKITGQTDTCELYDVQVRNESSPRARCAFHYWTVSPLLSLTVLISLLLLGGGELALVYNSKIK